MGYPGRFGPTSSPTVPRPAGPRTTGTSTGIRVGEIRVADFAPRPLLLVLLGLVLAPQTEEQKNGAGCPRKTEPACAAALLLLARARARGPAAKPARVCVAARVHRGPAAGAAVDIALFLHSHLLAIRVLLCAEAEQAHDAVPETAHDAAGAKKDQEDQTDDSANNDTGDSAR